VAIGRIIQGLRVFKFIEKQKLKEERPINDIKIIKCGTEGWWNFKSPQIKHQSNN